MKLPRFARARARRLVESPPELLRVIERASRKLVSAGKARRLQPVLAELRTMLDLLMAWARGEYSGISKSNLLLIVGAVVYFLMPADFVPDVIIGLGFADDAAVIAVVLNAVRDELEKFKVTVGGPKKPGDVPPRTVPLAWLVVTVAIAFAATVVATLCVI